MNYHTWVLDVDDRDDFSKLMPTDLDLPFLWNLIALGKILQPTAVGLLYMVNPLPRLLKLKLKSLVHVKIEHLHWILSLRDIGVKFFQHFQIL